jgi:flagellum-specific peptidoglycan hydrolase FlgJ
MNESKEGLMTSTQRTVLSPLLDEIKKQLSPASGAAPTLEQRLASLNQAEIDTIMRTAKFVQMAMRMNVAVNNNTMGWADLVNSMYGRMALSRRSLIAELLEETDPLDFTPEPKQSAEETGLSLYDRPEYQMSPQPAASQADDDTVEALKIALTDVIPEPQPKQKQSHVAVGKEEFLKAYTPVAKEVAADLGISHKIVLAQAALESGWGKSVKGNGLMGIKSHGEDGGVDVVTHEVINGKRVKITDSFRAYDTPEDSILGYGKFLKANSRYRHFLRAGADNEDAQLSALQSSGYATDPMYSQKLKNIIKGIPDEEGA